MMYNIKNRKTAVATMNLTNSRPTYNFKDIGFTPHTCIVRLIHFERGTITTGKYFELQSELFGNSSFACFDVGQSIPQSHLTVTGNVQGLTNFRIMNAQTSQDVAAVFDGSLTLVLEFVEYQK